MRPPAAMRTGGSGQGNGRLHTFHRDVAENATSGGIKRKERFALNWPIYWPVRWQVVRRFSHSFIVLPAFVALAASVGLAFQGARPAAVVKAPAPASGGSLVSSVRSEPPTFNRYADQNSVVETITFLMHSRLVRINRRTMEVEPMLAESWTRSKDNLTYSVKLRRGVKWSDGAPFSAADVVFSFRAIYQKDKDNAYESPIGDSMQVAGKPLVVSRVDDSTVTIRFPSAYGPGLRILDNLPIYPSHLLAQALNDGTLQKAWAVTTPPAKIAGLGPFVLKEYQSGQRLVFERNPNYWRKDAAGRPLPYLDRITLEIVQDQNAELLRMQSGQLYCIRSEIRADDYKTLKEAASAAKVKLYDLGPGLDADSLWFNLRSDAKMPESKRAWLQHVELRRAINEAVNRERFVNTVFFGAAVPALGPISPANRTWFDPRIAGP
jgi:peptide/nickel transport system substrate-binding protein